MKCVFDELDKKIHIFKVKISRMFDCKMIIINDCDSLLQWDLSLSLSLMLAVEITVLFNTPLTEVILPSSSSSTNTSYHHHEDVQQDQDEGIYYFHK